MRCIAGWIQWKAPHNQWSLQLPLTMPWSLSTKIEYFVSHVLRFIRRNYKQFKRDYVTFFVIPFLKLHIPLAENTKRFNNIMLKSSDLISIMYVCNRSPTLIIQRAYSNGIGEFDNLVLTSLDLINSMYKSALLTHSNYSKSFKGILLYIINKISIILTLITIESLTIDHSNYSKSRFSPFQNFSINIITCYVSYIQLEFVE